MCLISLLIVDSSEHVDEDGRHGHTNFPRNCKEKLLYQKSVASVFYMLTREGILLIMKSAHRLGIPLS